jgi:IS1 family transposase
VVLRRQEAARKVTQSDSTDKGDQYVFLALEGAHKAILSYAVGKRDMETTCIFMSDLRQRIINQPVINSDAFSAYPEVIERYFGHGVSYGQIVMSFAGEPPKDAARRYSPGYVVGVETRVVSGRPGRISTSYIERKNLSLRMALGVTDHVWSVAELVSAATTEAPITDRPRFGRFQVIQGGGA